MKTELDRIKFNRVRNSIIAFIQGKQDIDWIMGVIKGRYGVRGEKLKQIFDLIPYTVPRFDNIRFQKLKEKCMKEGLFNQKE